MLSVPGTSVPAERVFSAAGATVTARHSNLSSKNVDKLLILNKDSHKVSPITNIKICELDEFLHRINLT